MFEEEKGMMKKPLKRSKNKFFENIA